MGSKAYQQEHTNQKWNRCQQCDRTRIVLNIALRIGAYPHQDPAQNSEQAKPAANGDKHRGHKHPAEAQKPLPYRMHCARGPRAEAALFI